MLLTMDARAHKTPSKEKKKRKQKTKAPRYPADQLIKNHMSTPFFSLGASN